MRNLTISLGLIAVIGALVAAPAFAASNVVLGGVGQRATDGSTFGFSVCNNGASAVTAPVPVTVVANGETTNTQSASSIASGACAYTYLPYSSFGMIGGHSYSVQISLNGGAPVSYTVTMPGAVLGASTVNLAVAGPVDQNRINLMANEVVLMHQLISLLQNKLGL